MIILTFIAAVVEAKILALCIAFIEIKLILITLFAPAIIVIMWKPPYISNRFRRSHNVKDNKGCSKHKQHRLRTVLKKLFQFAG